MPTWIDAEDETWHVDSILIDLDIFQLLLLMDYQAPSKDQNKGSHG